MRQAGPGSLAGSQLQPALFCPVLNQVSFLGSLPETQLLFPGTFFRYLDLHFLSWYHPPLIAVCHLQDQVPARGYIKNITITILQRRKDKKCLVAPLNMLLNQIDAYHIRKRDLLEPQAGNSRSETRVSVILEFLRTFRKRRMARAVSGNGCPMPIARPCWIA